MRPLKRSFPEDRGTSIPDLQSMLDTFGLKHEFYRAVGSTSPITPTYVRRKLDSGLMAIVFTGVTPYGAVKSRSRIRHWVVVEDILRVGRQRLAARLQSLSPTAKRAYRFDEVFDLPSREFIGLWVEPRPAAAAEVTLAEAVARSIDRAPRRPRQLAT